jgi:Flp pilus assembly protein TadD
VHAKGKYREAKAEYQRALALQPDDANAHRNFGNALLREGRPDEAIAEYRRARAFTPDDAEFHEILGSVLSIKV